MKSLTRLLAIFAVAALALACFAPVRSNAENTVEYEEKTITFDLSEEDPETTLDLTDFGEYFTCGAITGDSVCAVGDDGEGFLNAYAHVYLTEEGSDELLQGPYSVSLKYYTATKGDAGIYVRGIRPELTAAENVVLNNTSMSFWYYEWNWYKEHQGAGNSTTGGCGIKVSNSGGNVLLSINTHEDDGLHVSSRVVKLTPPDGFDPNGMNEYKITDDNKSHIELFVNGTLLATVDYSGEPSDYPDEEGVIMENGVLYYKNAVVKGADGTELLNIDNARIAAEVPIIALGNRNGETRFKDFAITYSAPKKAPTPEPTEAPTPAPTDKPADKPTDKPAESATKAPQSATSKPADNNEASPKKFPVVPVVAGVCGAIVVGAVIAIIVSGKKKK